MTTRRHKFLWELKENFRVSKFDGKIGRWYNIVNCIVGWKVKWKESSKFKTTGQRSGNSEGLDKRLRGEDVMGGEQAIIEKK